MIHLIVEAKSVRDTPDLTLPFWLPVSKQLVNLVSSLY